MIAGKRKHRRSDGSKTFEAAVRRWATKVGVKPQGIYLQRMTTKWASGSTRGRLCFSTDLLRGKAAFRDVVIVHELLHLQVPNHGKLFKSLMNAYVPGWEDLMPASTIFIGKRLDNYPLSGKICLREVRAHDKGRNTRRCCAGNPRLL